MTSGMTAFAVAVGGTSVICYLLMHRVQNRSARLERARSDGSGTGSSGDGWNLGFVVETERQVEAHLDEHLDQAGLPPNDARSRAIVKVMKDDEARHAAQAQAAGARELLAPIPTLMRFASSTMKKVAYRI